MIDKPQTTAALKFSKGDRVRLSAEGIKNLCNPNDKRSHPPERIGSVSQISHDERAFGIVWDGRTYPMMIHKDYLEVADA